MRCPRALDLMATVDVYPVAPTSNTITAPSTSSPFLATRQSDGSNAGWPNRLSSHSSIRRGEKRPCAENASSHTARTCSSSAGSNGPIATPSASSTSSTGWRLRSTRMRRTDRTYANPRRSSRRACPVRARREHPDGHRAPARTSEPAARSGRPGDRRAHVPRTRAPRSASASNSTSGSASHTYAYPMIRPVGPTMTQASDSSENRGRIQSSSRSCWVKSGSPKSAMSCAVTTAATISASWVVGARS